ncbi:hypothetical protein BKM03_11830 [Pseudomonas avellanae]|uniref:Uncharacterized protein n=1 Tax=Pseudomonas avellanae TaxID=46257 RepID=A0AAD0E040_9PSED|nr:hypothetical protein BKM03_11830 [Pseudomonas avellanae]OOK94077.1 hypothetical protein B0B36_24895 [Pseudomonas syringae pv. actinidifoliorum]POP88159.1 hypothetical protein CXB34_04670 [Pseudomonas amygdali pv. morsprunorum]
MPDLLACFRQERRLAPPQIGCRREADSTGSWRLRDIYLLYTSVSRQRRYLEIPEKPTVADGLDGFWP